MSRNDLVLNPENWFKRAAVGGDDLPETPSPLSSDEGSSLGSAKSVDSQEKGAAESPLENLYRESDLVNSPLVGMEISVSSSATAISSLTSEGTRSYGKSSKKKSGKSSDSSKSSTPSSHELNEYFRNYLYAPGAENANVSDLDSLAQSSPELLERLKQISDRDLARVATTSRNFLRASLVCYKNGFLEGSFSEIKIEPLSFEAEDMRLVKEYILGMEVEAALHSIRERMIEINRILETYSVSLEEVTGLKNRLSEFKEEKSKLNTCVSIAEKMLKDAVVKTEGPLKEDELNDIRKKLKKLDSKLECDSTLVDPMALSNLMQERYAAKCKELMPLPPKYKASCPDNLVGIVSYLKGIQEEKEGEIQRLSSDPKLNEYQSLEAEQKKCIALMTSEETLREVVGVQRGHSEDYLYHTLRKYREDGFLAGAVEQERKRTQVGYFDRFYLVISSTNDSCNRCSVVVESIHDLIQEEFNPDKDSNIKCKVLYFANKAMTLNNGTDLLKDYESFEAKSPGSIAENVINVTPSSSGRKVASGATPSSAAIAFPPLPPSVGFPGETSAFKQVAQGSGHEISPSRIFESQQLSRNNSSSASAASGLSEDSVLEDRSESELRPPRSTRASSTKIVSGRGGSGKTA